MDSVWARPLALARRWGVGSTAWLVATVATPVAASAAPSSFATEVLADGPFAYYRFDEPVGATTAVDSSGNGHSGTYSPMGITLGTFVTAGDHGAEFSDARVVVDDAPALTPTDVTLEAVVTWYGTTGIQQRVVEKSVAFTGTSPVYSMAIDADGTVLVELRLSGLTVGTSSTTALVPCRSYHLVGRYDRSEITVWVDGVLESTLAATGAIIKSDVPLGIGNQPTRDRPLAGAIDEVALYDAPLSAARIQAHVQTIADLGGDSCNGAGGSGGGGGSAGAPDAAAGGGGVPDAGVDAAAGAAGADTGVAGSGGMSGAPPAGAGGADPIDSGRAGADSALGGSGDSSAGGGGCSCRVGRAEPGGALALVLGLLLWRRPRRRRR